MAAKAKTVEMVLVTPEMALEWLSIPVKYQRSIRESHYKELASDMKAGRWRERAGGIISLDCNGGVADGRHRLMAVIESEVPTWFYVQRDVDIDDYKCFDSGMKRRAGDAIDMPNANNVVACSSVVLAMILGDTVKKSLKSSTKYTRRQLIDFIEANAEKLAHVERLSQKVRKAIANGSIKGYAAAVFASESIGGEAADLFYLDISDKLPVIPLAAAARTKICREYIDHRSMPAPWWVAATLLQAYLANATGKNLRTLNKQEHTLQKVELSLASHDWERDGWNLEAIDE